MPELNVFSDEDLKILVELLRRVKNTPVGNVRPIDDPPPVSPECYVALVPSGGLPALSGAIPGSTSCAIYRVFKSSVSGNVELAAITGFSQTVYNLSATSINPGFIVINREKFGFWIYECSCAT